jgi:hypothetical protein
LDFARHRQSRNATIETGADNFADYVAVSGGHGNDQLGDSVLFDKSLNGAERAHDGQFQQHVVLLGRIIVDEADGFEPEKRVGDELLCDEFARVTRAND